MATRTLHRRPIPWLFRLLGWMLLILTIIGGLVFIGIVGTGAYYEFTRTTDSDLRAMIDTEVPPNATADQIFRFLDTNGIEHADIQTVGSRDTKLIDEGVDRGTRVIRGLVRNDGYSLGLVDVVVWFVLDDELLMDEYIVYEVGR